MRPKSAQQRAESAIRSKNKILKPNPPVMVAVPAEIISEYLGGKIAEEISEIAFRWR